MIPKRILVTVSALALSIGAASADSNFANIEQSGSDNHGVVTQGPGAHNSFGTAGDAALQKGSDNRLTILQRGDRNNIGTEGDGFEQHGDLNEASITQRSDRNLVGEVIQKGRGVGSADPRNALTIVQGGADGDGDGNRIWRVRQVKTGNGDADDGNSADIRQTGSRNSIGGETSGGVVQKGLANTLAVRQRSDNNSIETIRQRGEDNTARIAQDMGNRNAIGAVRQHGDDNFLRIGQHGARNAIDHVTQNGQGNSARLSFDGDANGVNGFSGALTGIAAYAAGVSQGTVTQLIGANRLGYAVVGDRNSFGFWQEGDGNRANGSTEGNRNEIVLYQQGDGDTADFLQDGNRNQTAIGQIGDYNRAKVSITGSDNLTGAGQFGDRNRAEIDIDGNRNAILIGQLGDRNHADVTIDGNRNFALIGQQHDAGGRNSVTLSISGNDNNNPLYAGVHDFTGAAMTTASLAASGPLLPGAILQNGHGNSITMTVGQTDTTSNANMFAFAQDGARNTIVGTVDGNGNQAVVVQTGAGNFTSFSQVGNFNILGVSQ